MALAHSVSLEHNSFIESNNRANKNMKTQTQVVAEFNSLIAGDFNVRDFETTYGMLYVSPLTGLSLELHIDQPYAMEAMILKGDSIKSTGYRA